MTSANASQPTNRGPAVVAVTILVAAEATVLLLLGLGYLAELARGEASDAPVAAFVGLMSLGTAAGLALVTRGLWRRRRWSRAPALVVNLLLLPVAWTMLTQGAPELGAPILAWAVAIVVLLFAPNVAGEP